MVLNALLVFPREKAPGHKCKITASYSATLVLVDGQCFPFFCLVSLRLFLLLVVISV